MSTHTLSSQQGFDAMGRGVDVMADMLRAPRVEAKPTRQGGFKALLKRISAAWIENREAAALAAIYRHDPRLAAELRAARDRAEWSNEG